MDSTYKLTEEVNFRKLIRDSVKNNTDLINQIRFLKNIVSNLNIAIFIHDLKFQSHIWTNNNYYKIIGYTDEEVKTFGTDWTRKNYHSEDVHIIKERYDYFKQNKGETFSGVYRVKHKEGHWVWVYSNVAVYKRDEKGNPEQVVGICIDFSDNFKTMKQFKELYKENQQLRNQLSIERLTKREKEIIKLIAQGSTSQEIANEINISPSTVDNHRKHMLKKLNLRNIADLTRFATENGLD